MYIYVFENKNKLSFTNILYTDDHYHSPVRWGMDAAYGNSGWSSLKDLSSPSLLPILLYFQMKRNHLLVCMALFS